MPERRPIVSIAPAQRATPSAPTAPATTDPAPFFADTVPAPERRSAWKGTKRIGMQ